MRGKEPHVAREPQFGQPWTRYCIRPIIRNPLGKWPEFRFHFHINSNELWLSIKRNFYFTYREKNLLMHEDLAIQLISINQITEIFDKAENFSEGRAVVIKTNGLTTNTMQKYSDWDYKSVERKYDIYGYIDNQGKIVIPYKYSDASSFKNGKAKVFISGVGNKIIDKQGKEIQ